MYMLLSLSQGSKLAHSLTSTRARPTRDDDRGNSRNLDVAVRLIYLNLINLLASLRPLKIAYLV
jgi:hypothetical protein